MKTYSLPVIISLLLISCQQTGHKVVEVEFNVDKSLLSDSSFVSESGFSINPPKNWIRTENYNSELHKCLFYRIDNKLLAIYKSDTTNCALIISELQETDFDKIKGMVDESDTDQYRDSIWLDVQTSVFRYNTYEIIQIVFQNAELVVFKLFIHQLPGLYELDYIVPRTEIDKNIQSVESSIGSVERVQI